MFSLVYTDHTRQLAAEIHSLQYEQRHKEIILAVRKMREVTKKKMLNTKHAYYSRQWKHFKIYENFIFSELLSLLKQHCLSMNISISVSVS